MTESPGDITSMECAWCGYDTATVGATRCAECGADRIDRQRIEVIADWAAVMLGFGIIAVIPATSGFAALAMDNVVGVAVFAVIFAVLIIGLIWSIMIFRRLRVGDLRHPRRRHAAIATLLFLPWVVLYVVVAVLVAMPDQS